MKNRIIKSTLSILTLGLFLFLAFGSSADWKKKQFDTEAEFSEAFKYAKYEDVKKEFGEPYYKFLDVVGQEVTYRWHGVGVKGQSDAYLNFSAIEYGTNHFSGYEFKTWYTTDGYHAPSNDNTYTID